MVDLRSEYKIGMGITSIVPAFFMLLQYVLTMFTIRPLEVPEVLVLIFLCISIVVSSLVLFLSNKKYIFPIHALSHVYLLIGALLVMGSSGINRYSYFFFLLGFQLVIDSNYLPNIKRRIKSFIVLLLSVLIYPVISIMYFTLSSVYLGQFDSVAEYLFFFIFLATVTIIREYNRYIVTNQTINNIEKMEVHKRIQLHYEYSEYLKKDIQDINIKFRG